MNLQVIPTSAHSVLDYVASGINLVTPKLLRLEDVPPAALAPRLVGVAGAAYSLFTDYELGTVRLLPTPTHLVLDAAKGAFLASSPWLFGFAGKGTRYWLAHVILGTSDVLVALVSQTVPSNE
jgi:SPW repeat